MGVQIFQMSTLEKSSENICEFLFFRLRTHFLLFGVVFSTGAFLKKDLFCPEVSFETNLDWRKHPLQVFFYFFSIFSSFFPKNNTHILEELRYFCAKFHNFSMKILEETRVQSLTFLASFSEIA